MRRHFAELGFFELFRAPLLATLSAAVFCLDPLVVQGAASRDPARLPGAASLGYSVASRAADGRYITEPLSAPARVAPDGTVLLSPHIMGVTLRRAILLGTPSGFVSQREYLTRFGLLTVLQRRDIAPRQQPNVALTNGVGRTIAGTTLRGASYHIVPMDNEMLVRLSLSGTMLIFRAPIGIPIPMVIALLQSIG